MVRGKNSHSTFTSCAQFSSNFFHPILFSSNPVFVQFTFVHDLYSSNLFSSNFSPFPFFVQKKQKLEFVQYLRFFPLLSVLYSMGKIMKKISDLYFSTYHWKLGWWRHKNDTKITITRKTKIGKIWNLVFLSIEIWFGFSSIFFLLILSGNKPI